MDALKTAEERQSSFLSGLALESIQINFNFLKLTAAVKNNTQFVGLFDVKDTVMWYIPRQSVRCFCACDLFSVFVFE